MRKRVAMRVFGLAVMATGLASASAAPADAAYKVVHVENVDNWQVKELTSDLPSEPPHCILLSPVYDKYYVSIDYAQTVPIGEWPNGSVRVANDGWQLGAGSTGSVEIEFNGKARTFVMSRVDATTMGSPWLGADEDQFGWLAAMVFSPIRVRLPHDLSFTIPAAPTDVAPMANRCIQKLLVSADVARDPFAQPQAKPQPQAKAERPSDSRDPFAPAQPPVSAATAAASAAAHSLRAKPNADQVQAILKAGFDPAPRLIEAPPNAENEAAFVGLEFESIEGVVGFIETLNAGRTPDQNIQRFKDEQQKKCANTATFRAVSREEIAGIRFDRLAYTCREPGKEAMNGDLLIATDASRSQSILVLGSAKKDGEIHRRADLVFGGYEKTYR